MQQKGSLVEAERARFDFAHPAALSSTVLEELERIVNQEIRDNHEIVTDIMSIDDAKQSGAAALFGEKYGDTVRVLSMGSFSKELCGGTHARRTGDIGLFKITAEYGVASGVRRIEFVTGVAALNWMHKRLRVLQTVSQQLKTQPEVVEEKVALCLQTIKQQEKDLLQYKQGALQQESSHLRKDAQIHGDVAI